MKSVLVSLVLMALSPAAIAQFSEIHSKHWLFGLPQGTPDTNDLIIRDAYALSNNSETKFADWVAYRLTPEETYGTISGNRNFRSDPWLDSDERLEPSDYTRANARPLQFERGHLAPLANFKGSANISDTNFLSNIVPQSRDLNNGVWKILESRERTLVLFHQEVWVITGPLYEAFVDELPEADEDHSIPSAFWKIIYIEDGNSVRAAAFIMEQQPTGDLSDQVTDIDEIEQRSGLTFFPLLDGDDLKSDEDGDWVISPSIE